MRTGRQEHVAPVLREILLMPVLCQVVSHTSSRRTCSCSWNCTAYSTVVSFRWLHRRSQIFFAVGCTRLMPEMLKTFLVVTSLLVLYQISPKLPVNSTPHCTPPNKMWLSPSEGGALTICPYKFSPKIISRPGAASAPNKSEPPGYAYADEYRIVSDASCRLW